MMMSNWVLLVVLHLIFCTTYNQAYKVLTKKMCHAGALTALIELVGGAAALLLMPLFDLRFPTEPSVYFFLILACVFYALNDRLCTTVREGMDMSVYTIIKQFSTVFMIFAGIFFFKEALIWSKIVGAFLIVFSNMLVFFDRGKLRMDKYVLLGLLASLCAAIALFIDVNYSEQFNLAFYVCFTLVVPALMIMGVERISIGEMGRELSICDRRFLLITAASGALMTIAKLGAFQAGEVIIVAPLCSLVIMLNVLFEMIVLKERKDLGKKLLAGVLVMVSIWLIKR